MSGKFALVIANTEYIDSGLAQLTAPGKDAEDFARVLGDPNICAFDEVKVLLNEPEPIVRDGVFEFFNTKGRDDLLLMYFSGHGVRDEFGALHLAVKNTKRDRLHVTAIGSDFVSKLMDQCRSKRQILILDCCNSGAFNDGAKAALGGNMGIFDTFVSREGYGRVVLTATNSIQFAWEGKKIDELLGEKTENSLFTHFLVKGLKGEADIDGDGRITIDELYKYSSDQVAGLAPLQKPQKKANFEEGEIVLRQNIPFSEIPAKTLPEYLSDNTKSRDPEVRLLAVSQLKEVLNSRNFGKARAAKEVLEKMAAEDDSRRVSQAATQVLESTRQAEQLALQKIEEKRLATEKAEAERKAKEEVERLAVLEAEEERKAQEEAERLAEEKRQVEKKAEEEQKAKEEAEHLAALRVEEERLVAEKAEAERKATLKAQRLAKQKRRAEEMAEEERRAKEETERLAARKAEEERLAAEKAEEEQKAKLKAERVYEERRRAEKKAEEERKAKEEAKRLTTPRTEEQHLATEKALSPERRKFARPSWLLFATVGGTISIVVLCVFTAIKFFPSIFGGVATATAASTEAAAVTQPSSIEAPVTAIGGTATITFTQEPDNLNPLYTNRYFSGITREFWLKGLWSFDENNQPVPELAAEIPSIENGGISADARTLTIKLREDITWSDGEPLTADDFVFTYDMIISEKNTVSTRYPYADYVESVEASDSHTVIVHFKEPFAGWLSGIFSGAPTTGQGVLPKHVLQPVFDANGTIDNAEWNKAPIVGIGPFVFSEWESGNHIIFKANPNWIHPANLEQILIRIVPDDAAQEAAIIAGDTDIGVYLFSDQIARLETNGTVKVIAVASGYNESWFLNVNPATAHPAMLEVNVRKAIALATDRFTIVKDLLDESVNPVNVTFWDNTPPYDNPNLEPYPYDPEEARRLLDEAGWVDSNGDGTRDKGGVELVLRYITNEREMRKNVQAMVEQQWSKVGIGADLHNYSSDVFWNGYNDNGPQAQGLYDIAEYANTGAFPDPEASSNWRCSDISSANNPSGANWQGVCNDQLDALLKEQAMTLDTQKRINLFHQISKLMYDEVYYIGLWKDPDLWSVSNRLQNVNLSGATPFWNAHEWAVTK